jgi:hypothetical protein
MNYHNKESANKRDQKFFKSAIGHKKGARLNLLTGGPEKPGTTRE